MNASNKNLMIEMGVPLLPEPLYMALQVIDEKASLAHKAELKPSSLQSPSDSISYSNAQQELVFARNNQNSPFASSLR